MSSGASQMSGVTDPTNNNNPTNPSVSSGWRGGRGYQGYRGDRSGRGRDNQSQGRGHGRTTTHSPSTSVPKTKFRGNTSGMNGHVFQCFSEGGEAKQFTKTINVLGEYIGKTYTHPADLASLTNLTPALTPVVKPPEPTDKLSVLDKEIWTITVKKFCNRTEAQENNLVAIYKVIWGQCSEDMQSRLKGLDTFTTNDAASDCVWLLTHIRSIIHRFDEQNSFYLSSILALNQYVTCKQGEHESDLSYYERFLAAVDLYELYHGRIGQSPEALKAASDKPKMKETDRADLARERTLAMQFFYNADRVRYGIMWTNAKNEITAGFDKYPTSLRAAYNMIVNYEAPTPVYPTRRNNYVAPNPAPAPAPAPAIIPTTTSTPTSELSFVQTGEMLPGTDGITHNGVHCFKCDRYGHYANLCSGTPASKPAVQLFQHCSADPASHFTFAQPSAPSGIIPSNWVLLDSQSTVSVFCNANYLSNIRRSPHNLLVYTNGGTQESSLLGDVPNFGSVWYNPDSLANILSLAAVRKLCRVTMDTTTEPALCVHRTDGSIMRFLESPSGLYYHDPAMSSPAYSFVSTVDENKHRFTPRELEQANNALVLHRRLGRPAQARFERLLREGFIRNCPITVADAQRAVAIYGPCIANLKGTATKQHSSHVPTLIPQLLSPSVMEHHKDLTLCMDIFYVQQIPFFHTISRKLNFRTVTPLPDRSKATLLRETMLIKRLYESRGFTIPDIHADLEFDCIKLDLLPTQFNIVPADDHVGEIERSIRTVKERVRTLIHGLPFRRLPRLMIRELVLAANKFLNMFPSDTGLSRTMSPLTIMTGRPNLDFHDLQLEFGSYVQVFEDNDPTNTTKSRNTGAIALSHTGNAQGDYFFMSLATGKRIARHAWTLIPMPLAVVAAVEHMADVEHQPTIEGGMPLFEWTPNNPVLDVDPAPLDPNTPPIPFLDDLEVINGPAPVVPLPHIHDAPEPPVVPSLAVLFPPDDVPPAVPLPDATVVVVGAPHDETPHGSQPGTSDGSTDATPASTSTVAPSAPAPYNLRPSRTPDYAHRFPDTQLLQHAVASFANNPRPLHNYVVGHIMTQMTAKAGIKKHGQLAVDALMREFLQLEEKNVFEAIMPDTLSGPQRANALRAINLIKEKREGTIKGRTCADGRPQRVHYSKEETTSPTISTDALMLTLLIDAKERRDVATADVTGAYLNADMDDFVLMRLTGETVDIMCTVNPAYTSFVSTIHGTPTLFLRLKKALYGCVKSALLWYNLFTSVLLDMGFTLNPYDSCVANCVIDGTQCTIGWYVDDNKISHANPLVVSDIIARIEAKFGKMTVTRGKHHTFLGMNLSFTDDGTVTINMSDYVRATISDSGFNLSPGGVSTPAKKDLFELDTTSPTLDPTRADTFHRVVAKLLYLAKRGRSDILLAVSFLTTRVSCSTDQDWLKLRRILQYLNGTPALFLTLGADSLTKLNTWVDAAYAVHQDMRSHTGAAISMGTGAFTCKSTKQKLNTKSSTEAEVVGASDFLPTTIWARMFLGSQGYDITDNIFHQDNQSAMLLERNGRSSSGQKTRHIDIRYFFMKDRIVTEHINVVYCPTASMLADFFTKPLQGCLFHDFRSVILGYSHISSLLKYTPKSVLLEERVEPQGQSSPDLLDSHTNTQNVRPSYATAAKRAL